MISIFMHQKELFTRKIIVYVKPRKKFNILFSKFVYQSWFGGGVNRNLYIIGKKRKGKR